MLLLIKDAKKVSFMQLGGACGEVKGERVKGVFSTSNFYYLFNLLPKVICQTVAAVPTPPPLVHSNEQPEKNLIPFPKDW